MIEREELYAKSPSVISRAVGDRIVLVPAFEKLGNEDCIFSLDGVGARIWELLDGKRSIGQLEEELQSEFDVPQEKLRQDIAEFISDLCEAGLINKVT